MHAYYQALDSESYSLARVERTYRRSLWFGAAVGLVGFLAGVITIAVAVVTG